MQTMDRSRWERVSPLLDELLDLDAEPRAERLAALRGQDPALGEELAGMLQRLDALEHDSFLQSPAKLPDPGMAGQTLGAYTIVRELGRGGMGSVWLAKRADGRYEGNVAVKFLSGGALLRGSAERFAREGSILARLAHPHIARLIDAGVSVEGLRYLVLEYIDGETIDRYCERMALDVTARVRLFIDVLAAVAHAHNRLILHRDIKPGNILVTGAGEVKLLDFGIAKLVDDVTTPAAATELTQLAGRAYTPAYAAPEQVEDGDVTTATDVYALGVLLFGLLGGGHPTAVAGSTTLEQLRAVVEAEPRRLSEAVGRKEGGGAAAAKRARELRGDLDNIVAKALKKVPGERYANAQQMADDLRRYLGHEPIAARPDAVAYQLGKFVQRHRAGVAASAVVAGALVVGISVALWEANEARRQRVQAEGLIEFMLGDLRKKLQPVGRLDVLDSVGEKALGYYAAQDAGQLDADSLGRRAQALHLIGEIAEARGNLDEAQRVFQQAADSTGELLTRFPRNGQRIFDHAQSVYWAGYIARRRGQLPNAEILFREYLNLADRLVRLDEKNINWRSEKAWADMNFGVVHLESWRTKQALQSFVEAQQAWSSVIILRPEMKGELANTFGWIAKARAALGDLDGAIQAQQTKIDLAHGMPGFAKDSDLQRLVANANYELSQLQLSRGHYGVAAQTARNALLQYEALAALDGSNVYFSAQTVLARLSMAQIDLALGNMDAARKGLQQSQSEASRIASDDVAASNWVIPLKGRLLALTSEVALASQQPLPLKELDSYVTGVQTLESTGASLDPDQTHAASSVEIVLGDALLHAGLAGAAKQHWLAAVRRLQKSADSGDLSMTTLLAHARLRLGALQEVQVLAVRIESSTYRHPAYADLRQRLALSRGTAPSQ